MYYTFEDADWFLSSEKREEFGKGTSIRMILSLNTTRTPKEIMDQYSDQHGRAAEVVFVFSMDARIQADPFRARTYRSQEVGPAKAQHRWGRVHGAAGVEQPALQRI